MQPVKYHLGKFPPGNLNWELISKYTAKANIALGRYDGMLATIPNANLFLAPLTTHEAVQSSKIEGTRVTMTEVMEIEAGLSKSVSQDKLDDTEEIINYRNTLKMCSEELRNRNISQHMLRTAHALLMQGVRGRDKSPGQYRSIQNWIGQKGCTIENANYIPIAPELLQSGMDTWENYLRENNRVDQIVSLALIHLEFEALHPFMDGNGRLGRMLIPLYLFQQGILKRPNFYMSDFLEANRSSYQEHMRNVSKNDDWNEWIIFFALGIEEQANKNIEKIRDILSLYSDMKEQFREATHSIHHIQALDFVFQNVTFSTGSFCKNSGILSDETAKVILRKLSKSGILTARSGVGRRQSVYLLQPLLNILDRAFM